MCTDGQGVIACCHEAKAAAAAATANAAEEIQDKATSHFTMHRSNTL
jgi:hypothetical protein